MEYEYDVIAYIGRFQPYHNGHKSLVDDALKKAKVVVIIIGSAASPRTPKNPFTSSERIQMITSAHPADAHRIHCIPQPDYMYNYDRWLSSVTAAITREGYAAVNPTGRGWSDGQMKIGLIGYDKDASSFYLRSFPQWSFVESPHPALIHATDIRRAYFSGDTANEVLNLVPDEVRAWMNNFYSQNAQAYYIVSQEWEAMEKYHEQWKNSPYPPTFLTADALVTQDAHVLMVTRGAYPGYGLLALPGGFLNPHETIQDCAIRELREETNINVPPAVLRGSIVADRVFDAPGRSLRGRTVTQVFHIKLNESSLPKVKGGDDAGAARWVPLSSLRSDQCFEDHHAIIETMTGAL